MGKLKRYYETVTTVEESAVYIGTWGNPLEWSRVDYICGDSSRSQGFSSIVCFNNKVSKYVIYVLDSIITAAKSVDRRGVEDFKENNPAYRCAEELKKSIKVGEINDGEKQTVSITIEPREEAILGKGSGGGLEAWRDVVTGYVRCIAKKMNVPTDNLYVIATEAMGKFTEWEYRAASPDTIMSIMLRGTWSAIEDLARSSSRLNIILDVTHGINFMPTVSYQVARYLASIALIAGAESVTISLYNSMPRTWSLVKVFTEEVRNIIIPPRPETRIMRAINYGAIALIPVLCSMRERREEGALDEATIDYGKKTIEYQPAVNNWLRVYEDAASEALCSSRDLPQGRRIRGRWVERENKLAVSLIDLLNWRFKDKLNIVTKTLIDDQLKSIDDLSKNCYKQLKNRPRRSSNKNDQTIMFLKMSLYDLKRECEGEKIQGKKIQTYQEEKKDKQKCKSDHDLRNFIAHVGILDTLTYLVYDAEKRDFCLVFDEELLKCLDLPK